MSYTHSTAASSRNFQLMFHNALKAYEKRTKNDLAAHPLATQLQACASPDAILIVLQQQVQELNRHRATDERWTKWLDPTVNVLYVLSETLGKSVGLVFSPAKVVFAGIGVLLLAAKDVRASQDTLIEILERIENFIRRLGTYTEVPPTTEMMDVIMKVMVEVLCILAIATKEIKQSRTKKYLKKLLRRTDLEDALKRLDKLTQEEARMVIAQNLKATHIVDRRVRGVAARVVGIDDRVARVEDTVINVNDRVAGVDARVAGVNDSVAIIDERVQAVDNKVAAAVDGTKKGRLIIQRISNSVGQVRKNVDHVKRNQLQESIHKWLSPSDPSTNHNIACGTYHKRTASWLFQGSIFREWMSSGSLLWIHGKPGSGKSVLCSTIIQDIEAMCKAGQGSIVYFYFDFRNINKQHLSDLIPSLVTQLSTHSDTRCDILSRLYSDHDNGKKQPSDTALAQCLKKMLMLPNQPPIYLIIDALDESPDSAGMPTPREQVLQLVKELIDLGLPNLHICVTSRPEIDIRRVIEPLTSLHICLHEQSEQKKDIAEYVRSIVYSDSEPIMRRWRTEDKELVIETLTERANGMYRWVFCQLEALRHCLPPSVRRTLDELPESLDETYERILKEIKKTNREHALRLLQCLVAAIRPLYIEELAEVLAVDFDDAEGVPRLKVDWRWEDQEQALLSSCSSLIAIVDDGEFRLVQFSHFSVREFLTSPRLATSCGGISRYHVDLEPAHTIVAQACLGVLLHLDDPVGKKAIRNDSPLAQYAARYWVTHAQYQNVWKQVERAMECLFDRDQPYFDVWLWLYNIDPGTMTMSPSPPFDLFTISKEFGATPLYYAALFGFHDLAKHLVSKNPQHVNANGGLYYRPLLAAFNGHHFQTAEILLRNGADPNVQGHKKRTPLHSAVDWGDFEVVQKLIEYGADVNARNDDGWTPLYGASGGHHFNPNVIRLLFERGADVNVRATDRSTPLHRASMCGSAKMVQTLIDYGADINAQNEAGQTPLYEASKHMNSGRNVIGLLLECGADANVRAADCSTPLHMASKYRIVEVVQKLIDYGADINAQDEAGRTPLYLASKTLSFGHPNVIRLLLERGVDANARATDRSTPLHMASTQMGVEVVQILIDYGADINAQDETGRTPLHMASESLGDPDIIRLLLERGADVNARATDRSTPLHLAMKWRIIDVVQRLIEYGADINAQDDAGRTPLYKASEGTYRMYPNIVRLLLERGADANARATDCSTPLHMASKHRGVEVVQILIDYGADINAQDEAGRTPLYFALKARVRNSSGVIRLLLECGADANARQTDGSTLLHMASWQGSVEVVQKLIEHGADVNARDEAGRTPLYLALEYMDMEYMYMGSKDLNVIRLLLERGADANARAMDDSTPLQMASRYGCIKAPRILFKHGSDVGTEDNEGRLHWVIRGGVRDKMIKLLLEYGAK